MEMINATEGQGHFACAIEKRVPIAGVSTIFTGLRTRKTLQFEFLGLSY